MHPLRIAGWNNGHDPGLDDGCRNLRSDVTGRTDDRRAGAGPAAFALGYLAPGSSERRGQRGRGAECGPGFAATA
jgi:hypothetical protein